MNLPKLKLDIKNPKVRNAAIIIVLGLGGAGAWYHYIYGKLLTQRTELRAKVETRQGELDAILTMKNQLEKLREDTARANDRLDSLKSIFPDQKEIPKLILEITRIARAAGVETRRFNPMPDVEKEYYVENRYAMSVVGGYHQVASFVSFLANMPLLINLSEVTLSVNTNGLTPQEGFAFNSGDDTPKSVVATFTMTTFSSKR